MHGSPGVRGRGWCWPPEGLLSCGPRVCQASCLLQFGNPHVAAAFCASRLCSSMPLVNYGASIADHGCPAAELSLIDRLMVFS
jgi:hypothetical protein